MLVCIAKMSSAMCLRNNVAFARWQRNRILLQGTMATGISVGYLVQLAPVTVALLRRSFGFKNCE